ncbi:TetR/AcrR family transcriptional regulator [Paenibacillus koleovorans]|uniref:TetR/AcrR family transcriptional regulator n=1 Tax=Paenibacillus koleovorans TaxID=121608 RepID=UPI000FDCB274|nr:TetR/AcrR family transcriptional regulator [Paenibacillus koleovorans]
MTDKMDRRQVRTQQLLRQALLELIESKGIDSITVTDIATHAQVNRGTFYLHYRDVADLLEQWKEEAFERIRARAVQLDLNEAIACALNDEPYPTSIRLLEEFLANGDFFRVMFGPRGDLSYMLRFKELMRSNMYNKITYILPEESEQLVPLDYLLTYLSSANIGILQHWIESGMKLSPREVSLIMMRILCLGPLAATGYKLGKIQLPRISTSAQRDG